jgi:hypothetical protein
MAKHSSLQEHHEGPEAANRFQSTLSRILSVPKDELAKREAAYQNTRPAKKSRRPKPVHP